jgi:hypothetical protein
VPWAYEESGAYKSQNKEKGLTKTKNEGTGTYKGQNEGNRPSKKLCSAEIQKVPRAFESLNPALYLSYIICRKYKFNVGK